MANVALSTDRESWLGHMKLNSQKLLMNNAAVLSSTQEELAKAATANHVSCASSEDPLLSLSDSISLSSMAFSLDDDEAQKQVKEYAKKLQQDEHKRKRYHDERMSANEMSDGVAANGSAADSPGWTHGAEMKFDARELLVTKTVLLTGSSCAAKRAEIREYFHRTFSLYERLFELLADSSVFYRRPDSLRHPLIFYYGHTAVFFVNKLMLGKFISKRIDEKIESTCAIGVDEMSWDDLNDSHYDWPTPEAVRNYRNLVRSSVDDVIQSAPLQLPITWESPFWVILMGIEHERIHLETSSVLIRQLPIECVRTHPLWQICPKRRLEVSTVPKNRLINIDGGQITLGKDKQTSSMYGWDNEYGTRVRNVAPFAVSQFLVSNAEWLEFMADGGYDREELWTSEGWKFIQFKNEQRKYPIFWVPLDGSISPAAKATNFRYRALSEVMSMPWDWPVEVNQLEAKAFTNWKSIITGKKIRLPTEDEYNHMRNVAFPLVPKGSSQNNGPSATASSSSATSTSVSPSSSVDLGDQPYWSCAPGNVNLEFYASSNPIDQFGFSLPKTTTAAIDSVHDTDSVDTPSTELFDVVGNVWQHTETPIAPLAGFQFHPLYDDFSIPTFDNLHNLLMGGSWISTGNEAIRSARYAFRRHFYQHAGIRYVESAQSVTIEEQTPSTETDLVVANMAAAHYSKLADIAPFRDLPNSFVQLARIVMEAVEHERHRFTRVQLRPSLFTRRELSALELAQLESVAHLPPSFERVLDLGCGAGRLAFELAFQGNHPQSQSQRAENAAHGVSVRAFDSVLGIDLSTRFLRVGDSLKHGGKFHYLVKSEGELDAFHAIDLSDPNFCARNDLRWALDPVVRKQVCSKVEFMQSDAHNFDGKHSAFDVIVAAHLLEEMYEPQQLLAVLHARCKLGGIVVIVSDYHWRTDKTDKSKWLGGKKENTGESVNTLNALDTAMSAHFVRINTPQTLTNMRRATDRVFSLHISELTIWRRVK